MAKAIPVARWAQAGLRLKVAAMLFTCALVSLGIGTLVATYFGERALRAEVADKATRTLNADMLDLERWLDRAMYDLTTLAETNVMQDVLIADGIGEIARSLAAMRTRYREFAAFVVTDETGAVIAAEGADLSPGQDLDIDHLDQSLAGLPVVGGFDAHPGLADDSFLFSVPIRAEYDQSTVIGVLSGTIGMDRLREQLARVQIGDEAQGSERALLLRNGEGRLLYRTGSEAADEIVQRLLAAVEGAAPGEALVRDQGPDLVTSAQFPAESPFAHLELQMLSGVTEQAAFGSIAQLKRTLTLTTIFLGLTMLVFGWIASRGLTDPITAMSAAMNRLSMGARNESRTPEVAELIAPSILDRKDEIGLLARSFDGLITQLAQARARLIEQSELEIAKRNMRLDAALNNMSQGLCMYGPKGELVVHNRRFEEIYGLPSGALKPGMKIAQILEVVNRAGHATEAQDADFISLLTRRDSDRETLTHLASTGDGRSVSVSCVPMPAGGWVATFEDVTQRKRDEARIEHMAHHDALTDLPNRLLFTRRIEETLAVAARGRQHAVLYLDLDHFKAVNDLHGHPAGDELLRHVGARLRGCLRPSGVVARLGGDEFAIVESDIASGEEARKLAERIIEEITRPFEIAGHQVAIGTSIGIALYPDDGDDAQTLVKAADMALYRAKADGRNGFRFFEQEMDSSMQQRRMLERDLRLALQNDEFEVHYQPIVDMATGRVSCFEALLRWTHPQRGGVSPAEFIPLAEEIGLIGEIGAWVLQRACDAAAGWPAHVRIAVNLSPAQFRSQQLLDQVAQALSQAGLDPQRLELEITESVLLRQSELVLSILKQLRGMGVRVSMDDFGTGYSSLGYLRSFPFDKIKIDRSFIRDIEKSGDALSIVRAITGLGTSLGMTTTAEGVETFEQLNQLRSEGCNEVQGFYYSPAVRLDAVPALLDGIGADHHGNTSAASNSRPKRIPA
ncbi:MAG: bifunctional diguanylate cyclase/phosphodiesterase [Limimaricola soesokkakensis]|uniref:bifunctional diguanylate cyclase/phosphodiesterase n=1 Tax=Limimaricola soesokkakensis TaxID=1343159 RepID=UPI00405845E1